MSESRLAARYAIPILELADEKGVLEEVKRDMQQFLGLCNTNRDLTLMLKSPVIPHLKKAVILRKIFTGKVNSLTLDAFDIITRKSRERYLPKIAEVFLQKYNIKKGIQEVTLSTPIPITEELRKEFKQLVRKISNKEPLINEKVDSELIGGYILKMEDLQLDDSISGQLKELALKFKRETI